MQDISEQEKERRRRINGSVIGSHAMEGLHFDAATLSLLRQYEEGQLSEDELGVALDAYAQELVARTRIAGAA